MKSGGSISIRRSAVKSRKLGPLSITDGSNRNLNRVQVVPITSNVARVYPCESSIDLNGEHRKAMADQIATVSKQRLKSRLATLSLDDIRAIERAIRVHLGLSSLTSFS